MIFSAPERFIPAAKDAEISSSKAFWFLFKKNELLVFASSVNRLEVPYIKDPSDIAISIVARQCIGHYDGKPCYTAEVPDSTQKNDDFIWSGLRSLYGKLDDDLFAISGRAYQIADWYRNHQFCGRCGERNKLQDGERCLICPSLAGFAEPGETLEQTVHREVHEEVGIRVKNIRYFASQPWPFPHSLMIAFHADYASGEINIDPNEIEDAGWFSATKLPERLPGPISISRKLIIDTLKRLESV